MNQNINFGVRILRSLICQIADSDREDVPKSNSALSAFFGQQRRRLLQSEQQQQLQQTQQEQTHNLSLHHASPQTAVQKIESTIQSIVAQNPTSVTTLDGCGENAVHVATSQHLPVSTLQILYNANPVAFGTLTSSGETPLHFAAKADGFVVNIEQKLHTVRFLVSKFPQSRTVQCFCLENTPLHHLANRSYSCCCNASVSNNDDSDADSRHHNTTTLQNHLHLQELVNSLVDNCEDVLFSKNGYGKTPLALCLKSRCGDYSDRRLHRIAEAVAPISNTNSNIIHQTADHPHHDCLANMLYSKTIRYCYQNANAQNSIMNPVGRTTALRRTFEMLCDAGNLDFIQDMVLQRFHMLANFDFGGGWMPLHVACAVYNTMNRIGRHEIIEWLFHRDRSILVVAEESNHATPIHLLLGCVDEDNHSSNTENIEALVWDLIQQAVDPTHLMIQKDSANLSILMLAASKDMTLSFLYMLVRYDISLHHQS